MKCNLKSLLHGLLAVGVFSAMGCSKSSELGLSLVEQEQSDIIASDTFSVILTTQEVTGQNRTETYSRSQMVCGAISDPEWGDSEASIYMNFRLASTGAKFENTVFDSLVLTLAYEDYGHYGEIRTHKPTNTTQSWDVLRITEDILETEFYKSDASFATEPIPLKSNFQFTANDTAAVNLGGADLAPHIRIRLDDLAGLNLGESLLHPNAANGDTIIYSSNNEFKDWFKGVYIRPTPGWNNNSLIRMQSKHPMTKLTLHYTDTSNNGAVAKAFEFLTNEDAEVVSTFAHVHSNDLIDNVVTDTISYVQGLDGLHTKITFPSVESLGNVVINKAELVVMVADTGSQEFPEIFQINAKIKDSGGNLVVIDDIATSLIRVQSYLLFGGAYEATNNGNSFLYRMHIAEEMQAIVNGTTTENAIYLTTPSALDPERIKLVNHRGINQVKLYLTYTKIQ